ncbi:EAL domain-containing protein [Subtercola sp. Z020]|uniref:sensor domain-containing phosphodiesterase n=1 Tax=Subtercola sp. Z020 TaxID=2080582 RepID=UPI00130E7F3E|nr:EAL domain-containing protein [Subtercola sp. Z020]
MPKNTATEDATAEEVRRIIAQGDLHTVFQPIVDLETRSTVAFEALSRGPVGSVAEMPDTLFEVAARVGLTGELDQACVAASLSAAQRAGIVEPLSLFVNVEAEALSLFADLLPLNLVVVVEITERDLLDDLGMLLRSAARLRSAGLKIAMDDVGSNPASLALLPLLQPDIIKLDMSLLQKQPSRHTARVMDAVSTYQEEFGAVVIAEGVETERHVVQARALGATLGQGWLFGRPSALVAIEAPPGVQVGPSTAAVQDEATPFTVAERSRAPKSSSKPLLIQASKFLEERALDGDRSTVVLSTFQLDSNFTDAMRAKYTALALHTSLVAVFVQEAANGMTLTTGVDRLELRSFPVADPLESEWSVIVLSATYAAMLTARELSGADNARNFEFVLTHNRDLVTRGALSLAVRL